MTLSVSLGPVSILVCVSSSGGSDGNIKAIIAMVRLTDRLELRLYRDKLNVSVQIDTIIYAETCQSIEADFYIEGGG